MAHYARMMANYVGTNVDEQLLACHIFVGECAHALADLDCADSPAVSHFYAQCKHANTPDMSKSPGHAASCFVARACILQHMQQVSLVLLLA